MIEARTRPARDGALAVLNAGSSSLKFSVLRIRDGALAPLLSGQLEGLFTSPRFVLRDAAGVRLDERAWGEGVRLGHDGALAHLLEVLDARLAGEALLGVGHRVVHGGARFAEPMRVDAALLAELRTLEPLAPLHQPHNLAPIAALLARAPGLPQVACFDTAFHRSNPELAQRFGLPDAMHEAGVRRYGFHGLSYEHVASVLPSIDPRAAAGRTIVAHLGNGASLCAMQGGRSVASTMGFTAVDGLLMGTRCGTLDPGVVLWLMRERGMSADEIQSLLYDRSGLLGVSGVSSDMRTLLASDAAGARRAIDLYCYRIGREIGSLAAALGGLDALVFTAGIGEHAAPVREAVCRHAAWLGARLDAAANAAGADRLHAPDSGLAIWRVPTNEEGMIARHTAAVLGLA
ncbi:MAG: acetate/propionate family kinase [Burkholderiales bacterium]|jgi:acetate kinase